MCKYANILVLIIMFFVPSCLAAQDVAAIKTNEQFQEVARIDQLQQIKVNTIPRTTYTPKNLRTQYELRFQGKNTATGAMTVWSNTFTDYDTKITSSEIINDQYFITDNAGNSFLTGEHVDLTPIQQSVLDLTANFNTTSIQVNENTANILTNSNKIEQNRQNISQNQQAIQANTQNIEINRQDIQQNRQYMTQNFHRIDTRVDLIEQRVDKLEQNVRSGLATVTALTSLHPNPRSKDIVELSLGTGIYKDQCAGAAGLFVHPTDNLMIQGGASFGNEDNWAGYVGITIGLDEILFKRHKSSQ